MPEIGLKITAIPVVDQKKINEVVQTYQQMLDAKPSTYTIRFNADTKALEASLNGLYSSAQRVTQQFANIGNAKMNNFNLDETIQNHQAKVRQLESEYVNLKARMAEASATLQGAAKESALKTIKEQIVEVGQEMKRVFSKGELSNFESLFGKITKSGSMKEIVTNVSQAQDAISGLNTRVIELSGSGEKLIRVKQQLGENGWEIVSVRTTDNVKTLETQIRNITNSLQVLMKSAGSDSSIGQQAQNLISQLEQVDVHSTTARQKITELSNAQKDLQQSYVYSTTALNNYKKITKSITEDMVALNAEKLKGIHANESYIQTLEENIRQKREEASIQKQAIVNEKEKKEAAELYSREVQKQTTIIEKQNEEYKKSNSLIYNFTTGMKDAVARVANYTIAYRVLWKIVQVTREAVETAKELNEAFTDIQMVTMYTNDSMKELADTYADLAYEMSSTVTDVAAGADEWLLIRSH